MNKQHTHEQELHSLRQKLFECEQALREKDLYLAKLELDLEHAIAQCKHIASNKIITIEALRDLRRTKASDLT